MMPGQRASGQDATARIPVIVLPGHLCDGRLFAPQRKALGDLGDMVVADLYGADTVGGMASGVLNAAPPRFAVVANSMGGAVAFEIMRRAPSRVRGLALIGTTARPEWASQRARRRPAAELAERGDTRALAELYLPVFFHPDRVRGNPGLLDTLEAMIRDAGIDGFRNQQAAFTNRPDSRPGLRDIDVPTLVLCGADDVITPVAMSREIAQGIPGARLVTIPDCGHIPMLEWPEATSEALRRWLGDLAGSECEPKD
jgi:pimeloyl-ACP methyl ester carboxylesterase